jgi:hypothetical protein
MNGLSSVLIVEMILIFDPGCTQARIEDPRNAEELQAKKNTCKVKSDLFRRVPRAIVNNRSELDCKSDPSWTYQTSKSKVPTECNDQIRPDLDSNRPEKSQQMTSPSISSIHSHDEHHPSDFQSTSSTSHPTQPTPS